MHDGSGCAGPQSGSRSTSLSGSYPSRTGRRAQSSSFPVQSCQRACICRPLRPQFFSFHNIAYGLYLWGWTVQQTLILILHVNGGLHLSPYIYYLLSMTATALIAGISRNCIEIPAERFLKKKLL